jgi:transcriptional regulator with AAA-type ATPase domain|tara:strand:- start:4506 stop:4760 length:255 start_codon:yes stop_codon:yes gene_type:complete
MENCKNKNELIALYGETYPPEFYKKWLELSVRKLKGFKSWRCSLNTHQYDTIRKMLLMDGPFSKEHFLLGLELLSYEQISYVGW